MVRIARRVPADQDMGVAALAPEMLVSQLDRLLASLPELPDPDAPPKSEPERSMEVRTGRDGWTRGRFCLPRRRPTTRVTAVGRARGRRVGHAQLRRRAPVELRGVRTAAWMACRRALRGRWRTARAQGP
jgi:hypothetical protein